MAVQSINTLQNKDNYNNIAQEYILESLANLGQRYNVQGDSISIGSFSFDKLFNLDGVDVKNTVVVVEKDKESGEYKIYLVGKNSNNAWDIYSPILSNQTLSTLVDSLEIEGPFNLENNPSVKYSAVVFKKNDLYYDFYCRETYTTIADKDNFILERYNKNTDTLVRGARVFKTHFLNSFKSHYILIDVSETLNNKYSVKILVSKDEISESSDTDIYNLLSNSDFNFDLYFDEAYSVTCDYDNYKIIADSALLNQFSNNDQDILQNDLLYSFTNDLKNIYPYLKEEYCISNYGKIDTIYVKILQNLYDTVKNSENLKEDNKLYIPLTCKENENGTFDYYTISYTYNTNKEEVLYFAGKEIEVRFVESVIDNDWFENNFEDYKGTIISHTGSCERVSFYYFESELDNLSNYVQDIRVRKISTLPYIDKNGYWVINDISTGIYAKGRSAGNPNIIIVETTNKEGGYNIITGAKKYELLEKLDWRNKIAKVEPLERINLDNLTFKNEFDYFSVNCSIPDTTKINEVDRQEYLALLENSIIICISPVSCINYDNNDNTDNINYSVEDVLNIYGEFGIITTIWTLNDNYEYDYLRKKNNEFAAADFNYLSNINNLIQYAVKNTEPLHPDNYEFTRLVFDSINTSLKNNVSETPTYIYPNLINKLSQEYTNVSNYNNDVNFTFKANNVITKSNDGRNIDHLSQGSDVKYYNATYNTSEVNSANVVTNSLYMYRENGTLKRYSEYIPNYNVPSLDLGEVITRNETLLNRLNILSLNSQGTAYLSYIGTSFENNKNILTIGTSNTNINMGTDTLISENDRNTFETQDKLEINIENVEISGETKLDKNLDVEKNIYLNGVVWQKNNSTLKTHTTINDTTYYTGIVTPTSRYIYELDDNNGTAGLIEILPEKGEYFTYTDPEEPITDDEGNIIGYGKISGALTSIPDEDSNLKSLLSYNIYKYAFENNKLYTISTIAEYYYVQTQTYDHKIYFSDGIYLPVLLSQLGLSKYIKEKSGEINTSNVIVTSNMDIIKVNGNPIVLLSSSTNLYPDKYLYKRINSIEEDTKVEIITNFTYSLFTANPIKITYYTSGANLYIHLEELYSKNKFTTIKKLKQNYTI